jgi:hypothetical protein
MEKLLNQLVEKLRKAHGADLVSVVLYGSAAEAGQHDEGFSDINVLSVLRQVSTRELAQAQPVFEWWAQHQTLPPLLLSEQEVASSTDCFAIEFHDMRHRRRILFGRDVIEGLVIDEAFYRVQVEYELRIKLLRLRQKAAAVLSNRTLLCRLLLDSVSTFSVLTRHALLLDGTDAPSARRIVWKLAGERLGIDPAPFLALIDVREKKLKPGQIQPDAMLGQVLEQIGKIIDAVDRLAKPMAAGAKGDE